MMGLIGPSNGARPRLAAGSNAKQLVGGAGRLLCAGLADAGRLTLFVGATTRRLFQLTLRGRAVLAQIEFIGARSLGVVALSAVFTGLVLAL